LNHRIYKIAKFKGFNFFKKISQDALFKDISTFDCIIERCHSSVRAELADDYQKYIQNTQDEKKGTQDHLTSLFSEDEFDINELDDYDLEFSEDEDDFEYGNSSFSFSQEEE